MTDRFSDDLVLRPVNSEGPPPAFVDTLLRRLRCFDAPRVDQEAAITAWLADHEPNSSLTEDLLEEGFGHLLPRKLSA